MPRTRHISRMAFLGAALLLALVGSQGAAVAGTTITVNTTDDELNSDGDCSLREAIQAANTDAAVDACPAGSGDDTITLPAGTYILSIAGAGEDSNATGDLDITTNLTINGAGADITIIDGNALDRVFHILTGSTVDISGVTVRNGSSIVGAGILNSGALTLTNTIVVSNSGGKGGGIVNSHVGSPPPDAPLPTLTLTNSTVSSNTVTIDDGAGAGIFNDGTLTLNRSTVSGNTATGADVLGGGIVSATGTGSITLTNSTISGNTASHGGGIFNQGPLALTNSTVSGNTATVVGGGIWSNAPLTLVTLINSIIANSPSGGDCSGVVTSLGHNLDSDNTCGLTQPTDLTGVNPLLGPLQANGGPTLTHALLTGSLAIDAGDDSVLGTPLFLTSDQRGEPRLEGLHVDIGAFEFQPPPPTPTPVPGITGPGLVAMAGLLLTALLWTTGRRRRQSGV